MMSVGAHKLAQGAGAFALALGAAVLAGWAFDIEALTGPLIGVEAMPLATAVGFMLTGSSALIQLDSQAPLRRRSAGRACGLLAAGIGVIALTHYTLGVDLEIDRLLISLLPTKSSVSSSAHMAPNTALCFVLIGTALVVLDAGARSLRWSSQALAIAVLLVGFACLLGHLLSAGEIYGIADGPPMAAHTAAGFVALSLGALALRPQRGVVAVLAQEGSAGVAIRRLLTTSIGLMSIVAWLVWRGRHAGQYGAPLAAALTAVAMAAVALWTTRAQGSSERDRQDLLRDERLLFEIGDLLRTCSQPLELLFQVSARLGKHLRVSRCFFAEINVAATRSTIRRDYHDGVRSLAGVLSLASYSADDLAAIRAGHTVVNNDTLRDPRTAALHDTAYRPLDIRASVIVPLRSGTRLAAALFATTHEPQDWRAREVAMIQGVAEQAWLRFEQLSTEHRFQMFVDAVKDYSILLLDPEGVVTSWNAGAERLTGYRADEIIGQKAARFFAPDDLELGKPEHELEVAARDGSYEDEGWRVRKDGSRLWVNVVVTALRNASGDLIGFGKVTRDMTHRMRNNEQFRRALEAVPTGMLMTDPRGKIALVNATVEAMFGYAREELLGKPVETLVPDRFRGHHPQHRAAFLDNPQTRLMGAGRDLYGRRKDGSEIPIEIGLNPFRTPEGDFVLSSIVDITERKRPMEQLRLAIEAAPTSMLMVDRQGTIVVVNAQVEQLFGYARDVLVGRPVEMLVPARFRGAHSVLRDGFFRHPQFRAMGGGRDLYGLHRDGSEVPIEIGLNPIHTETGDFVLSSIVDVSDRKRAQKALRESEARLRLAQHVAGIGTFEWNIETGMNTWTPEMEAMHGVPTGSFAGSLEAWQRLVHPDDRAKIAAYAGHILEGGAAEGEAEWRVVWPDGTVRWLASHWKVFNSPAGKPLHVTGINIDLTERKRAEQERERLVTQLGALNAELEERVRGRTAQLTTALKERDVLLQEVHHRVKNNLQVISSLINMQIRKLVDRASRSGLEECRARVEAIALIHEKLYQSRDYARVPFSDYARSLAGNIFHASGVSPANITLGLDVEPTMLPVDKAIPCGLILNELITNALKHAFPGGRNGSIHVELRQAPGGAVMLVVSDDGIGLAHDVDPRSSTTLGMQLVSTLVEQLDGEIEVVRRDGMAFHVTFPVDNEHRTAIEGD